MNFPLVTCLCLTTAGRSDWLSIAAACFRQQDYPAERRELLIVPDSLDDIVWNREDWNAPNNVSVFWSTETANIGRKRNLGCGESVADVISVWDDDDYSDPGRLSQQVAELQATSKAVTGYRVMKFTDGAFWWQYSLARGFVFGTSLLFTRDWWKEHHFLDLNIGEDAGFAWDASEANQLSECPDLNLMYATIHPGNTSARKKRSDAGWVPLPGFSWKGKG